MVGSGGSRKQVRVVAEAGVGEGLGLCDCAESGEMRGIVDNVVSAAVASKKQRPRDPVHLT